MHYSLMNSGLEYELQSFAEYAHPGILVTLRLRGPGLRTGDYSRYSSKMAANSSQRGPRPQPSIQHVRGPRALSLQLGGDLSVLVAGSGE